ncbi:MAG: putative quinol monooxygenase [Fluviicola sp.]|jgi:quinol monooxygenase YgiN
MITRIVKLTFEEDKISDFIAFFDTIKHQVSGFENCFGMRLLQDKHKPHIVFTYSLWKDEDALNFYRDSELFQKTWSTIKPWFASKAEAWTVDQYYEGGFN